MKKFFIRIAVIMSAYAFAGCIFSCQKDVVVYEATEATLKESVDKQLKEKKWQEELESPKDYVLNLSEIKAPLPAACLAIIPSQNIYPVYKDFGSLDISRLENSIIKMLDAFFSKAAFPQREERIVEAGYLDPSYPFLSYVMQPYFEELPPVSNVIYGEPAFLENCIEIPARLNGEKNHTDLLIYVLKDKDVWYIEQVIFGELINE